MDYKFYKESADYIKGRVPKIGKTAIVLGSGLGSIADEIVVDEKISYRDIPHFPVSTAIGHEGSLVCGSLGDKNIVALLGRAHFYEGYDTEKSAYYVRVLKLLGVSNLIVTNASGGINQSFEIGDLMIVRDHISFFCKNPLIGQNIEEFGPRFNDMTFAYDRDLAEVALGAAFELAIDLREGVYGYVTGPSYETPAEIKALRILGADAVGMSTVPEAITAVHCGMKVLGISCITNMAAGILDAPLNHEEVLETGERTKIKFSTLIKSIISKI